MPTLEFKGKQHIYAHHLTIPYRPLVPDAAKSLNPAGAETTIIIHGDNLKALKALLPRYCPAASSASTSTRHTTPDNTGNEGWVYNEQSG